MELAPILIAIFCFVIIKNHMEQRARERARRLQLLEEAIKSGNVDQNTVEDLAAALSGGKPARRRADGTPKPRGAGWLALGWIGIFVGLGVAGIGGVSNEESAIGAGVLVTLISFGITTYPLALRELEARRRA